MMKVPYRSIQWVCSGALASALAVLLLLAPVFLKQDVDPSDVARFSQPVSLRKLTQTPPEPEEKMPEQEEPKPEPLTAEPLALSPIAAPPVSPIQPEILHVDIGANLAQAVAISIPRHSGVLSLGDVDEAPVPIFTPPPMYPSKARRRRLESKLIIKMIVTSQGNVQKATVESGEYLETFREPALRAVRKWRFKPAQLHGKPVAVLVTLPLEFTCKN
ncbi:energy transducer TonB [Halodesulfovibrio sp. MK-HDV]|uniref:energy transducer TonB n=1 Tax=Halodesulfovibrio sp. MK-HDV TaxID=2599925 RepID=UPI0013693FF2|nr:energy transducer TonB [Halodesulfovibrio sp. MK-HDV]KAF1074888.1 hypothetical protein MKHDV_02440 [Halodesulfovibrio sp. MK-HDV]